MLTYLTSDTATAARQNTHAVLFLHAFPLSASMWLPQLEALGKAGVRAIAPNAYGIEGSEEKSEWNFTGYAHELATLLESLGIEQVTIVGLSMGGYQALEFYRLYAAKTASLVLSDTRAEADTPEARSQREEFIKAVETLGAEEAARRMVPNYFTPRSLTKKPELGSEATTMITRQSPGVINAAMRAIMTRSDATGSLAAIHCPVLVLCGADDRLTTPETAKNISNLIPGSQLHLIAGAAHISNMEQPGAFSTALLKHIGEIGLA